MKKHFFVALLAASALLVGSAAQAQTLTARPGDLLAWDQPQGDTVTSFEINVDGAGFSSIGLPAVSNDGDTPIGFNTYTWQIPVNTTFGAHAYAVRACDVNSVPDQCGPELAGNVTIGSTAPSQPSGFRIRPQSGQASLILLPPGTRAPQNGGQ